MRNAPKRALERGEAAADLLKSAREAMLVAVVMPAASVLSFKNWN